MTVESLIHLLNAYCIQSSMLHADIYSSILVSLDRGPPVTAQEKYHYIRERSS